MWIAPHTPLIALTTLIVALTPHEKAFAQRVPNNASTRLVASQILDSRIYNQLLREGYAKSHEPEFTYLENNRYKEYSYEVQAGYSYFFLGKCDEDCDDLDLKLYSSDGDLLDADTSSDDYPVVRFTPRRDRTLVLRVIMASCSSTCWSAVVAQRKASP